MGLRIKKVPIFADTNLGTHIALDVIPTLTADDFRRELEEAHLNCFPKLGKIKINGLMVKRKSVFYHLPDSYIKHVFQGYGQRWFLHIEACFVSELMKPKFSPSGILSSVEPRNHVPNFDANYASHKTGNIGTESVLCPKAAPSLVAPEEGHVDRNEDGCTKGEVGDEIELGAIPENHSEAISEAVSVSGILKKYFCDHEDETLNSEVTSRTNQGQSRTGADGNCSREKFKETRLFGPKTPARTISFPLAKGSREKISKDKLRSGEMGKRLLVVSNELGSFKSSRKSSRGLYCCKGRKTSEPTYSSLGKSLVFEIPDDDE